MQDAEVADGNTLLMWMLLLLIVTASLFWWRCHRAGVFAAFGRHPPAWPSLVRVGVAAGMPAVLCSGWIAIWPESSLWAMLGMLHLATSWYGLRWLLPDGLVMRPDERSGPTT
jgi:hypothetical protein